MDLMAVLEAHRAEDEKEAEDLRLILRFVRSQQNPFDRRITSGHLTGSAIVISATGREVLLLHHLKLSRWLQPGGHAEAGERAGEEVALREGREETGIRGLLLHDRAPRPLDVDVHDIPARGDEPAHQHLDLRYLVVAPEGAVVSPAAGESRRIRWFGWDELGPLGLDAGLVRALEKVRKLLPPTSA